MICRNGQTYPIKSKMYEPKIKEEEDFLEFTHGIEFNGQSSYLFRVHKICEARDNAFNEGDLGRFYRSSLSLFSNVQFRLEEKRLPYKDFLDHLLLMVNKVIENEKNNNTKPNILNHNRRLYELEILKVNTYINTLMNEAGLIFPKKSFKTVGDMRENDY